MNKTILSYIFIALSIIFLFWSNRRDRLDDDRVNEFAEEGEVYIRK